MRRFFLIAFILTVPISFFLMGVSIEANTHGLQVARITGASYVTIMSGRHFDTPKIEENDAPDEGEQG